MEITPLGRWGRRLAVLALAVAGTGALAGCEQLSKLFPPSEAIPDGCPTGEVVVHVSGYSLDVVPGSEPNSWVGTASVDLTNNTSASVDSELVWANVETDENIGMVALALPGPLAPGATGTASATFELGDLESVTAPVAGPVSALPLVDWVEADDVCPSPKVVAD